MFSVTTVHHSLPSYQILRSTGFIVGSPFFCTHSRKPPVNSTGGFQSGCSLLGAVALGPSAPLALLGLVHPEKDVLGVVLDDSPTLETEPVCLSPCCALSHEKPSGLFVIEIDRCGVVYRHVLEEIVSLLQICSDILRDVYGGGAAGLGDGDVKWHDCTFLGRNYSL